MTNPHRNRVYCDEECSRKARNRRVREMGAANPMPPADYRELPSESAIVSRAQPIGPRSGVYFLVDSSLREVVYVGQTTNLFLRLGAHLSEGEISFDSCYWIPFRRRVLNDAEGHFIAALNPPLNKTLPRVTRSVASLLAEMKKKVANDD
jgi:hypothetical protein